MTVKLASLCIMAVVWGAAMVWLGNAFYLTATTASKPTVHTCTPDQWTDAYTLGYEQGWANAVTEFKKGKH